MIIQNKDESLIIMFIKHDRSVLCKMRILHPMDPGYPMDGKGEVRDPHFIKRISFYLADEVITTLELDLWTSQDPNFSFNIPVVPEKTEFLVRWEDNLTKVEEFSAKIRYHK